jgi:hypothetical protein
MASIRKEILIDTDPSTAWEALRDFAAVHERVARGFVIDSRLEDDEHIDRVITFVNGAVARERLVACDDEHRRLVYSIVESALGFAHHQASVEVREADPAVSGTLLVWTTDVLPDSVGPTVDAMMTQGAAAIASTLAR